MVRKPRLQKKFLVTDALKEALPFLIIVDQGADVAVTGPVRLPMTGMQAPIATAIERGIVGEATEMIDQYKTVIDPNIGTSMRWPAPVRT